MARRKRHTNVSLPAPKATKVKARRKPPLIEEHKGTTIPICPFCQNKHPISASEVAPCGTYLEIMAVQQVVSGKHITCALCKQAGGSMTKVGNDYVHTHDCTPGVTLHPVRPKNSWTAAVAWRLMPDRLTLWVAKKFGITPQVLGPLDDAGKIAKVEGYAWQRIRMPSS